MSQREHTITPEEANEILDSANNGYSVEVWLPVNGVPSKGLLIVNPNMDGRFDFTQWEVYQAPCEAVEVTYERWEAWNKLIEIRTTGINV